MKRIIYHLPEEHESPVLPDGFKVIGYLVNVKQNVKSSTENEVYQYAILILSFLEENLEFVCVADDGNTTIYCPADFSTGKYAKEWFWDLDTGQPFDLSEYRMMQ